MDKALRLSIIVLNYQLDQLLEDCLRSILQYIDVPNCEILMLDNASPNQAWRRFENDFPMVNFVALPQNFGFAKANNLGAEMARGEYLLFLNPDTLWEENMMKTLLDFADAQPNFGALGIQMHDAQGRFLPESKRNSPEPWAAFKKIFLPFSPQNQHKSYYRNDIAPEAIAPVEVLTGAFLLIKKKLYLQVGGFDERYFMYGEDIDLCYTLHQQNYQNYYYGAHKMLHYKGESGPKDKVYLSRFYGAMAIFVQKYYGQHFWMKTCLMLGLKLKHAWALFKIFLNKSTPNKSPQIL
jgi:N-acetylglucosaminyl-diphospho-decaprenol L-rhamnosyltransferase